MNLLKKLNISCLCNIVICCFFFISYLFLCKDIIIQLDPLRDAFEPFFSYADHGNYVIQAIIRLITFTIPYHLGIHPMDFAGTFGLCFKALVLVGLGVLFASITLNEITLKSTKPIILFFFQTAILAILFQTGFWQVECANGFGRFIIAQYFLILFWTYFIKFYNNNTLPSKKQTIFLCILALIAGNIQELIAFSSALALFLLLIIDLIKNKKTNLYLIFALVFVIFGGLLMYFNPNYVFSAKTHTGDVTLQTIITCLKDYKTFFNIYVYEIFRRHIGFHLLIIVLFIISLIKGSKKEILVPSLLYIGLLTFFASFIVAKGDITYYQNFMSEDKNYPNYWLTHHDFPLIIRLYSLFVISLLFNCFLRKFSNVSKNILLIYFIFINILIVQIDYVLKLSSYGFYNRVLDQLKERKIQFYQIDSMVLHHYSNNAQITVFNPPNSQDMFYDYPNYIEKIYDVNVQKENLVIVDKAKALDVFYSSGGTFTEEELQNPKFNYLFKKYNKKFNNKKPVKLYYWMEWIDNTPELNIKLRIKNKFLNLMNKRENQTI